MPVSHFRKMARYNEWAGGLLFDAVQDIGNDYARDCGAFFTSIHGTLNHILHVDRIWLSRVLGDEIKGFDLAAQLYPDYSSLRAARAQEDARIHRVLGDMSDDDMLREVSYHTSAGQPFSTPLQTIFTHQFNHATHHRGQVHDMLTRMGHDAPPLDLIFFDRVD